MSLLSLIVHSLCLGVVWFVLVETILSLWNKIKLSLLSASIREKHFTVYTGAPVLFFLSVYFYGQLLLDAGKSVLCDDCTTFPFFLFSALFSVHVYSGIFWKEMVNLVLHMFIPQTVLEGTLRAWVCPLAYFLAWTYDIESLLVDFS